MLHIGEKVCQDKGNKSHTVCKEVYFKHGLNYQRTTDSVARHVSSLAGNCPSSADVHTDLVSCEMDLDANQETKPVQVSCPLTDFR